MAVSILTSFGGHSTYIYALAVVVTVIVILVSTTYTIRRWFNIRAVNTTSDQMKTKTDESCPCDVFGNDSDNNADLKDGQETGQLLSPRYPDPVEYCEHIQGEFKRVQQSVATRTIKKSLTEQQLEEEKEVQRRQLGEIFRLMQEQQDRFGIGSVDDMQEQMKLYAL